MNNTRSGCLRGPGLAWYSLRYTESHNRSGRRRFLDVPGSAVAKLDEESPPACPRSYGQPTLGPNPALLHADYTEQHRRLNSRSRRVLETASLGRCFLAADLTITSLADSLFLLQRTHLDTTKASPAKQMTSKRFADLSKPVRSGGPPPSSGRCCLSTQRSQRSFLGVVLAALAGIQAHGHGTLLQIRWVGGEAGGDRGRQRFQRRPRLVDTARPSGAQPCSASSGRSTTTGRTRSPRSRQGRTAPSARLHSAGGPRTRTARRSRRVRPSPRRRPLHQSGCCRRPSAAARARRRGASTGARRSTPWEAPRKALARRRARTTARGTCRERWAAREECGGSVPSLRAGVVAGWGDQRRTRSARRRTTHDAEVGCVPCKGYGWAACERLGSVRPAAQLDAPCSSSTRRCNVTPGNLESARPRLAAGSASGRQV